MNNFFTELKRRNVYKVAVAYVVASWALAQGSSQLLPIFDIPIWVVRLVVLLLIIGFPVAIVLSWAFEITPEGIKRAEEVDLNNSVTKKTGRKLIAFTVVVAMIAAALLLFQLVRSKREPESLVATIPNKSIAVLPFDNLSRDLDNAYFAEGVQDEILTRLAKVADLKVISRTSTQHFKSASGNLPDIAKQLGVANILEGSVQKSGDQVRVNVQLINAMTNAHLWAEIYDRKLSDIFAVQSDIAKTVADTLQAKLTGSEKQMMASQETTDTTAYELYHKGRSLWEKRSGDNIPKAIAFYEQAIARDPNYALAYARSGECPYSASFLYGRGPARRRTEGKRCGAQSSPALIPIWPKHIRRSAKFSSLAISISPERCANMNAPSSSSQTTRRHIIGWATTPWQLSDDSRKLLQRASARSSWIRSRPLLTRTWA